MKPVKEVLHIFTRGIILALALGFYFVKKAIRLYEIPKQTQEPERQGTQGKES